MQDMKSGTHSNTHPHVNKLSYEENVEQLEKSNEKIENLIGQKTNLYRTPYGEYNNTVIQSAEDKGYYSIQWNLDTLDYKGLTGEEMYFLEVSSTGVERILRKDKHLQGAIGKQIEVKLFKPIEKQKEYVGTLQSFDEEKIEIELENKEKIEIERKNISQMKLKYNW